jgi:hypothetical protein
MGLFMDQFMKMRKKMSMAESTRQVLNKSIDLLHKLSNKKIAKETARKELSAVLSQYFSSLGSGLAIDQERKVKLEIFLDQAYEIIEKVDAGDAPLYEAIMMMNKVVVNNQMEEAGKERVSSIRPPEPKMKMREEISRSDYDDEDEEEEEEFRRVEKTPRKAKEHSRQISGSTRFESSIQEEVGDANQEVSLLIGEVLKQREALEKAVKHLNAVLHELGFELRSLSVK